MEPEKPNVGNLEGQMPEREKRFKEVKGYKSKIKRHKDAVLKIHSMQGIGGDMLISGSADHTVRIWNLKEEKLSKRIDV